jgi:hypothetical protein
VLFANVAQRWKQLIGRGRMAPRTVAGIYGLPRGGTNLIAAALHYHPHVFAVNEHFCDYRVPLASIWRRRSVFRSDGRQEKRIDEVRAVVYNKMQEFRPELWNPRGTFPDSSRFVFYVRNPIRVHLSREAYRRKRDPGRSDWADTPANFASVLTEAREILEARAILQERHPCLLLSHEYFCCRHDRALAALHEFLGLQPMPPADPRDFFRRCGRCGRDFALTGPLGEQWLICPRHRRRVCGSGKFNPLRPVDCKSVLDDSWKTTPHVDRMMSQCRAVLGAAAADYFWNDDYADNLFGERALSSPVCRREPFAPGASGGSPGKEAVYHGHHEQRLPV